MTPLLPAVRGPEDGEVPGEAGRDPGHPAGAEDPLPEAASGGSGQVQALGCGKHGGLSC